MCCPAVWVREEGSDEVELLEQDHTLKEADYGLHLELHSATLAVPWIHAIVTGILPAPPSLTSGTLLRACLFLAGEAEEVQLGAGEAKYNTLINKRDRTASPLPNLILQLSSGLCSGITRCTSSSVGSLD